MRVRLDCGQDQEWRMSTENSKETPAVLLDLALRAEAEGKRLRVNCGFGDTETRTAEEWRRTWERGQFIWTNLRNWAVVE
jgi:hypothetical protein